MPTKKTYGYGFVIADDLSLAKTEKQAVDEAKAEAQITGYKWLVVKIVGLAEESTDATFTPGEYNPNG